MQLSELTTTNQKLVAENDRLKSERDKARAERDKARAKRDDVMSLKDQLVAENDRLKSERDQARAERDQLKGLLEVQHEMKGRREQKHRAMEAELVLALAYINEHCQAAAAHRQVLEDEATAARAQAEEALEANRTVMRERDRMRKSKYDLIAEHEKQVKKAVAHAREEAAAQLSSVWLTLSAKIDDDTAVRAFFARRQPSSAGGNQLRIERIIKVENRQTLDAFRGTRFFNVNPLEAHSQGCDTLLFHGCPDSVAANIQATGLLLSHAANGMLGRGLYGASDPRKSLQYCRSQDKFMFICRFNLSGAQHAGPHTQHRNSVFDEFCVYDEEHTVVLWMLKLA